MVEALDALTARAVHAAHVFERAVHDGGPWAVVLDGRQAAEAERVEGPASITFTASFPPACRLTPGPVVAELCARGELVDVRLVEVPDEGGFDLVWQVGVPAAVGA